MCVRVDRGNPEVAGKGVGMVAGQKEVEWAYAPLGKRGGLHGLVKNAKFGRSI